MELFLIDAIGPFFRDHPLNRINWSKIPFEYLQLEGEARRRQFDGIRTDMRSFADQVSDIGYNAVTLDDLAHLADHDLYEDHVRGRISIFQEEFRELFSILRSRDLKIFLTSDVMFYTVGLREKLGGDLDAALGFLEELIDQFFTEFSEIEGLILRIGESDGLDVGGEFRSELVLRHARHVRLMMKRLLPIFEKHGKKLIFRTWTVGAYSVGDLMWHRRTLARALKGVESPALMLSMKYGESDFFRFLPLNRNFFGSDIPKIVELQARREYEGCGEYPSFVGSDYERYANQLADAPNIAGICVWCQTGGWLPFRRLAFLEDEAIWTVINTYVSLRVFKHGDLAEHAVRECTDYLGLGDWEAVWEILRLSDEVVQELLYIPEFAREKLFFRRVRVPPLLAVYWNTIFINHSIKKVLRHYISDTEACLRAGKQAMRKIDRMVDLADQAGLPKKDLIFMRDTFEILALSREYFFGPWSEDLKKRIKKAKKAYKKKYPKGGRFRYRINTNYEPFKISPRFLSWSLWLISRKRPGYRVVDRLFTLHLLGYIYGFIQKRRPQWIPEFARKSAMGIDTVFR